MRRLGRRALLLFGAYTAVILAAVIAGFLGGAVGIWASVLWGTVLLGGLVFYLRRRGANPASTREHAGHLALGYGHHGARDRRHPRTEGQSQLDH